MASTNVIEELTMNRYGEDGTFPGRQRRFYDSAGYWYYATREGIDIGPFDSLSEAEAGASAFIDFVLHAEPDVLQSINKYRCSGSTAAA